MQNLIVDNLREIDNSHTTVRRLDIASQCIKRIGDRRVPVEIIKKELIAWNIELNSYDPDYKDKKGKLVEGEENKPTTAFPKYITIIREMGLISQIGHTVSLTRTGYVLYQLIKEKEQFDYYLNSYEKLFYLFNLFSKDADYLLLALDTINCYKDGINQKDAQDKFKTNLENRLSNKLKIATNQARIKIAEKLRVVRHQWRKAEVYSEHILAPRFEWLTDLGILSTDKIKGSTIYRITPTGKLLMDKLPKFSDFDIHDINEEWLRNYAFKNFVTLLSIEDIKNWTEIDPHLQNEYLGAALDESYQLFSGGRALRIALSPFVLYTCINFMVEKKVLVEINDIINKLKARFLYKDRIYNAFVAARQNEGYVSIKINR